MDEGFWPRNRKILFIVSIFVAQIIHVWRFVGRFAVNLLTNDDWDDLVPLFKPSSAWEMFRFRHGPRRLGVGLWVTDIVHTLSGWDLRVHTFVMAGFLAATAVLALWLKLRIFGKLHWTDAIIPLIVLNLNQWELLLYLPLNGIVMLFLLLLLALAFTVDARWPRYALIVALNFLLIHTGYGMFAVGATGLWLLLMLKRDPRTAITLGLIHLGIIAVFFRGYVSEPGLACFKFPHDRPWEYFIFAAYMFPRFFGFVKTTGFSAALAVALFVGSFYFLFWAARTPEKKLSRVVFVLLAFSLLYQFNAAVGRVCTSVAAGKVSRYVTFQIPQALAWYFAALAIPRDVYRRVGVGAIVALAVFSALYLDPRDARYLREYSSERAAWLECFAAKRDIDACTQQSGFPLYPEPKDPRVLEELEFLRVHQLHFFKK